MEFLYQTKFETIPGVNLTMEIKSLTNTSFDEIIDCLLKAFEGYFVTMPNDKDYWQQRFKAAGVNYEWSSGAFADGKLVGFMIHAFDPKNKSAHNTGTGVLTEYRGRQLVDLMYNWSLPIFRENGIRQCQLEVIDQNHKAIKVYERIGFSIKRVLKCFSGTQIIPTTGNVTKQEFPIDQLNTISRSGVDYAWDNKDGCIRSDPKNYQCYSVALEGDYIGYFIINPKNGYIAQLDAINKQWSPIFTAIGNISSEFKINNIDSNRKGLIDHLQSIKAQNTINQFEMVMKI